MRQAFSLRVYLRQGPWSAFKALLGHEERNEPLVDRPQAVFEGDEVERIRFVESHFEINMRQFATSSGDTEIGVVVSDECELVALLTCPNTLKVRLNENRIGDRVLIRVAWRLSGHCTVSSFYPGGVAGFDNRRCVEHRFNAIERDSCFAANQKEFDATRRSSTERQCLSPGRRDPSSKWHLGPH